MKRLLGIMLLVALATSAVAVPAVADSGERSVLVMADAGGLSITAAARISAAGGRIVGEIPAAGMYVVESANVRVDAALSAIPGVAAVAPNVTTQWIDTSTVHSEVEAGQVADDDGEFLRFLQWNMDAIGVQDARALGARGAGVRVAVLDTGFDLTHPDLASQINMDLSKNFVPDEDLQFGVMSAYCHGSHVAGIISSPENGYGLSGVAPEAELVLIKVLSDSGEGRLANVIEGIIYAADIGADVINMSLSTTFERAGSCNEEGCLNALQIAQVKNALARATTYAHDKGAVIVAAAGNEVVDLDRSRELIVLPAESPYVLAISSTAPQGWYVHPEDAMLDYPASYSNYGMSHIAFAAPGGDMAYSGPELCTVLNYPPLPCGGLDMVISTGGWGQYYWTVGTSVAAAHVSGVAALIIGQHDGSMDPTQVEAIMAASADDLGRPGRDSRYGQGRVNAAKAVE